MIRSSFAVAALAWMPALVGCAGPYAGSDAVDGGTDTSDVRVGVLGVARAAVVGGFVGPLVFDEGTSGLADDGSGMLALLADGTSADGALYIMPSSGYVDDLVTILHTPGVHTSRAADLSSKLIGRSCTFNEDSDMPHYDAPVDVDVIVAQPGDVSPGEPNVTVTMNGSGTEASALIIVR